MIDIHSHVLYGMDDGSPTLEVSVAMVRMAAQNGTTDLVATPHSNLQYKFHPDVIAARLAEVSAAAGGVLRLHTGCDFHLSYDNIQDAIAHPEKYTINHKRYLMVEFSDLLVFKNTPEIFGRLQDGGMIPVITHPERNGLLRQRVEDISLWVATGARVQVTAQSVTGDFGRKASDFCKLLLERGLVHFIASDAHDLEHRPPRMDLAYEFVKKNYSESLAEALCVHNPQAAIDGEDFDGSMMETRTEAKKWYQIWR